MGVGLCINRSLVRGPFGGVPGYSVVGVGVNVGSVLPTPIAYAVAISSALSASNAC